MRISHMRFSTIASLALGFLYACTDSNGLSVNYDGALPATGGATRGTGGGISATGGSTSGTGGTTSETGGTTSGAGGTKSGTGGNATSTGGAKGGTGGAATGFGGTKGGLGGAISVTGGAGGAGTGAGGTGGTGGRTTGTGGKDGKDGKDGSVIDAGAGRDASTDVMCGPVCLIYCPFGNKLDSDGCLTCVCNPDPQLDGGVDAKPIDTRPIICPAIACADILCENGYLTDANGCPTCTCKPSWVACDSLTGESDCTAAGSRCKWLTPGCGTPALSASGCHDQTHLNCTSSCPAGLTCLQRSINPCFNAACDACGQQIGICL